MASPSDVVVVGAGIVGCAVAYELARRGASVEIVDDRPAGMGATQASAGMLAPYIEGRQGGPLLDLTVRSLDLFDTFVARVTSVSGLPVRYRRSGTLDVALQESTLAVLKASSERLAARGVVAELLDRRATREREPHLADGVLGGLIIPGQGFVAASELTRALEAAARRHGAQFIEQGRVTRISRAGGDLKVETGRGSLVGQSVVVAAGSWAGQIEIEGVAPVPVRPVRGQLLQLAWNGPPLERVIWGERCYLVPWDDGTLLVGATVEEAGFDERTTVAGVRDLIEAACELVPQAWTATLPGGASGPAARDARRAADHWPFGRAAECHVRDGALPKRRPAGAADGAARGRRHAGARRRSAARAREAAALRCPVTEFSLEAARVRLDAVRAPRPV